MQNLRVTFDHRNRPGPCRARVSFSLGASGWGIVGESGSGKTMTGRSGPASDPPAGRISGGPDGVRRGNLMLPRETDMRALRGKRIAW